MDKSIFNNYDELFKFISELKSRWEIKIFYKFYKSYDDGDGKYFIPIGPKSGYNFDSDFWRSHQTSNDFKRGIIIDIYDTDIFFDVSMDEQRLGRVFSKIDFDKMEILMRDLENLKYKCEDEFYTFSVFISNTGYNSSTNFTKEAPFSINIINDNE